MKLNLNYALTKTKEKSYSYLTVIDDDGTYRADVHTWSKFQQVLEYIAKNREINVYFNDEKTGYYCILDEDKIPLYGGKF